jgi:hypothetical protein
MRLQRVQYYGKNSNQGKAELSVGSYQLKTRNIKSKNGY